MPARNRWAPPLKLGSAQGFFLLVREFFLATVTLGLALSGPHARTLCEAALSQSCIAYKYKYKGAIQIKFNLISPSEEEIEGAAVKA